MDNRCPNCGYPNGTYETRCRKCGGTLEEVLKTEKSAMNDMRVFSLIYLVTAVIGTVTFVYRYIGFNQFSYGFFSNVPNITPGQAISAVTPYMFVFEAISGISIIITLVSVFFLRGGLKKLKKLDEEFDSPHLGTTLFFVGLVLVAISTFALLLLLIGMIPDLSRSPPAIPFNILAILAPVAIVLVVGAIVLIVGVILAVILGLHRIAEKFDDSRFEAAWVLYIIGIFFAPVSLIAAYLSYDGASSSMKKIRKALSGEGGDGEMQ